VEKKFKKNFGGYFWDIKEQNWLKIAFKNGF
jgi:hypothetical protein